VPGFPIRTPSDHSSVDSSPRTIAASHVLHRLLMPRHPPCALDNLTNTPANITKKQFKQNCCWKNSNREQDARVHCTILNDHTDHPDTTPQVRASNDRPRENTPPPRTAGSHEPAPPSRGQLSSQDPTVRRHHGVSTFSRATPHTFPTTHTPKSVDGRYWWGPPPGHRGMDADTRRADHTPHQAFGEAP
jgi:hypothetical protein